MQEVPTAKMLRSRVGISSGALYMAALIFVFGLGIGLRLYGLGDESYWLDEVTMVRLTAGPFEHVVSQILNGRPPVFVLMGYGWVHLFGTSEVATRMLSAVGGIAALFVFYSLAWRLFDRWTALIVLFIMGISEFQISQAQNYRYYSVFVFFAVLSYTTFLNFLSRRSWVNLSLYVLTTVLLYYTHTFGLFIIMAQGIYFLTQWFRMPELRLRWFISQCLIGLLILPNFLIAFTKTSSGSANVMTWISGSPLERGIVALFQFFLPARDYAVPAVLATGAVVFGVITAVFIVRKGWRNWWADVRGLGGELNELRLQKGDALLLTGLWLLIPIIVPVILSYALGPIFVSRYAICAAPALYILMGVAFVAAGKVVPVLAPLSLLTIWIAPGLLGYYVQPVNEQWREAAALVEQNGQPGDIIIFAPAEQGSSTAQIFGPGLLRAFSWYYDEDLPNCSLSEELLDRSAVATAFEQCIAGKERFWLVMRGDPIRVAPFVDFFLEAPPASVQLVQEHEFTDLSVYTFTLND